uniref:Nicotinamide N-methyltransferase n=1 Tax=Chelonoidis abingdonii TaxID=106734 RepID=A0A8C0IQE1_CHEAB
MDQSCPKKEAFEKRFDPKECLIIYCSFDSTNSEKNDILVFLLINFFKTFILDESGNTLIRIGDAPTIFELLSACESFREIIVTNHMDLNFQEVQKWLKKEPGEFDWTPMVKYVSEKEEKLRRTIKDADCLLLCYCLGTSCKDLSTYCAALKNVSYLLKPGGQLLVVTTMKCPCLFLEKEFLEEAVKEAGYDILKFEVTPICYPSSLLEHDGISYLVTSKGKGKED